MRVLSRSGKRRGCVLLYVLVLVGVMAPVARGPDRLEVLLRSGRRARFRYAAPLRVVAARGLSRDEVERLLERRVVFARAGRAHVGLHPFAERRLRVGSRDSGGEGDGGDEGNAGAQGGLAHVFWVGRCREQNDCTRSSSSRIGSTG